MQKFSKAFLRKNKGLSFFRKVCVLKLFNIWDQTYYISNITYTLLSYNMQSIFHT
jgi:hypothetical protein